MTSKNKKCLLMGMMVLSFLFMCNTKYLRAPGDYLLEFIGLKSWTNNTSGTHLTVIYFGIVFFISLFLIKKQLINQSEMKWKSVVIVLVCSTVLYVFTIGTIIQVIMRNSDTITSIEYESEVGTLAFDKENGEYISFNVKFKLNNRSRDGRKFYVDLHGSRQREDGERRIRILDKNGQRAVFRLEGEESKIFDLNKDEYMLADDENHRNHRNYSTRGTLDEIILTDLSGASIVLRYDRIYSLKINR